MLSARIELRRVGLRGLDSRIGWRFLGVGCFGILFGSECVFLRNVVLVVVSVCGIIVGALALKLVLGSSNPTNFEYKVGFSRE